jgi:hypothetical protein
MVLTRADRKEVLTHVLENVLQLESGSPLVLAINQDGFQDIVELHCMQFKHIDEMQYKDADGIEVPLQKLHAYPLRIFKHFMLHILEECRKHDDTVKSFYAKCQALTVKEYDDFRVGSAYAALSNCTIEWARMDAKEYDEFRASPEYIDSVQETTHDSRSSSPVPKDDAIVVTYMSKASPVSKVMEKTIESTEECSIMSMDTSKIVSPISPADDTWPTIARESMIYWDTIAREADLHLKGENGLLTKDEIVTAHIADSLQQDMLPDAINFVDEMHIFEVPSPVLNTAISSSIPLVMPPLPNLLSDPRRKSLT